MRAEIFSRGDWPVGEATTAVAAETLSGRGDNSPLFVQLVVTDSSAGYSRMSSMTSP
jgi:hypothetical protein